MSRIPSSFDLHSHSTASDGRLTPKELLALAAEQGVKTLALTDHDTIAGLAAAEAAAQQHGLQLIRGVELSVSWERRTLHVVGLNIDPDNAELRKGLEYLQTQRTARAQAIAEKLTKLGIEDAWQQVSSAAGDAQVTRTHFARLLVASGIASDLKQAFKRYLGSGKPAYVRADWASLRQAINWIHAAGGLAILAHPMRYPMTARWRERCIAAFKEAGGDGLEVCSGACAAHEVSEAAKLAQRYELLGSIGSDFHGPEQRWLQLGRLAPLPSHLTPVWSRLAA